MSLTGFKTHVFKICTDGPDADVDAAEPEDGAGDVGAMALALAAAGLDGADDNDDMDL